MLMTRHADGRTHTSFICSVRGKDVCDALGRVLFQKVDGTKVPCDCECHER